MNTFNKDDVVVITRKGLKNTGARGFIVNSFTILRGAEVQLTSGHSKGKTIYFSYDSIALAAEPPVKPVAPAPVPVFEVGDKVRVVREELDKDGEEGEIRAIKQSMITFKHYANVVFENGEVRNYYLTSLAPVEKVPTVAEAFVKIADVLQEAPVAAPKKEALKKGDRVRVVNIPDKKHEDWKGAGYFEEAPAFEGKEGVVEYSGLELQHPIPNWARVTFPGGETWAFPFKCLEKAEELVELFDYYDPDNKDRGVHIGDQVTAITQGRIDNRKFEVVETLKPDDEEYLWIKPLMALSVFFGHK